MVLMEPRIGLILTRRRWCFVIMKLLGLWSP